MWGLKNVQREGFLVRLGDAFLEILSYSRPVGRPRPADHCIVDQGIMNIGLGSRNKTAIRALIGRIQAAGLKITVVMDSVDSVGTYVIEPGFEHEPMSTPPELDTQFGFARTGPFIAEFGLRPA